MSESAKTALDDAVEELLRNVAKLPGKLKASDLDTLRQNVGLGAVGRDDFYETVVKVVRLLPWPGEPHARLLLRLDDYDENLTKRRKIAHEKYHVPKEGAARICAERYVLAQVVYGVTQGVRPSRGQGYEFEAARFRYWFEDGNVDEMRVDAEFDLLVVRDDVRIFTYGSDPTSGTLYDIKCLSENVGHSFLRQVPIRSTAPTGERYAFFYLGGNIKSGTKTTIALREFWDNSGEAPVREQGVFPVSGGGRLTIVLDAPVAAISHYATFEERHERGNRAAPQKLLQRTNDDPISLPIETPTPGNIYGFWYKVADAAS